VQNGSVLKEMGLNAYQSANLLGRLEKSGVDSSQALTGLKMALKNATSEGKPLNVALAEMQQKIKGASNSTEAMSIA
jgi:phage-related minor tail protein